MSSPQILLIDRHRRWLKFAQETLGEAGYAVMIASDFDEATEYYLSQDFDLILIGLDQAESNLATLSDLAKDHHHPRRFVVMFPVRQTFDRVRIVFKAGVYDVVDKPYGGDILLEIVSKELEEARLRNNMASAIDAVVQTREHQGIIEERAQNG
jgi:DNA-binding NtrC family response regulator